jgi:hypothetical protein
MDCRSVRRSPCQALLPRTACAPRRAPSVPWSLACSWVAYKRGRRPPPRARPPCRSPGLPPAPWPPRRQSCHLWPVAHQNKLFPTFPCIHQSSPPIHQPLPSRPRRNRMVAAATVPGRRCRPSPTFSLPHPTPGIDPLRPRDPPPACARPAPTGSWPEFSRTAAARPPRDYIAKLRFFQGSLLQKVNSNSKTL